MNKFAIAMTTALMAAGSAASAEAADELPIIDRPDFVSPDGVFSIDALEALGRVSDPTVSPDGTRVLFGVSYESVEQNKSNNDLYVIDIKGGEPVRLTKTKGSESGARWMADGLHIAFIAADENGKPQLWIMNDDGTGRRQVSNVERGIEGFLFSPDESKVLLISTIDYGQKVIDDFPDLPKANARIIDDLMYKHWDQWVTEIPHPFIGDFDGETITNLIDIMADEPDFEAPMRPFGGTESFAWLPNSKGIIYVSRKKKGLDYSLSTNSDLFLYDLTTGSTRNLTEGMMGYDTNPIISPDGTTLAWLSMEHDGYESDKNRIFMMDLFSGVKTDLTANWDYTVDAIAWSPDSKSIYFIAPYLGTIPVFSVEIATKHIFTVAEGICDYAAICPLPKGRLLAMRHSMTYPNELFVLENGMERQLTHINSDILSQINMPTTWMHYVPTTDGKQMSTWVVLPQNFDVNKKYPVILYCQGGPQSPVSQFWSYRWNLALMAANGYIVVAPNRRGLPGFGTEWNAQISRDYPGQNMLDYLSAVDYIKEKPFVDTEHIGAVGASYGGFSVYWLAGNHDHRFACLIAHAGIFNIESQYLETEEMWFANWDMGGAPWDKDNEAAQRTFANSPHRFVDKWDTPILITHGEYDFRILASQGMMAFNAARLRGVPAEMVIFPDENHWILKPQNAILWQRVFFRWLDHWLKK